MVTDGVRCRGGFIQRYPSHPLIAYMISKSKITKGLLDFRLDKESYMMDLHMTSNTIYQDKGLEYSGVYDIQTLDE